MLFRYFKGCFEGLSPAEGRLARFMSCVSHHKSYKFSSEISDHIETVSCLFVKLTSCSLNSGIYFFDLTKFHAAASCFRFSEHFFYYRASTQPCRTVWGKLRLLCYRKFFISRFFPGGQTFQDGTWARKVSKLLSVFIPDIRDSLLIISSLSKPRLRKCWCIT